MKWTIPTIIASVFCMLLNFCNGQEDSFWDDVSLSTHFHYGASIYGYSSFTLLNEDYTRAFDIMIEKETHGKDSWESIYGYPTFGLAFYHTSLGNDEIFGYEYALFPWFKYNIVDIKRYRFSTLIGIGLGYANKTYDQETNPFNTVVGSHWNIHFQANFMNEFDLSDKWAVEAGLTFAHFSNGNSAEPNIGMNTVSLAAGLSYRIGEETEREYHDPGEADKRIFWELGLSAGKKSSRAFRSESHFTSALSGDLWKPLTHAFAIGLGPDIFYDSSAKIELLPNESVEYTPGTEWSSGLHGSISLRYNKFRFIFQAGAYVFKENVIFGNVMYNRAIFRYDIARNLYAHFALKSHREKLDYPELSIGYRWKRD